MTVLVVLLAASLLLAMAFLGAFLWAMSRGQYQDNDTPALRMLHDDVTVRPRSTESLNQPNDINHP